MFDEEEGRKTTKYLVFGEHRAAEAPGDGGRGVAGGLAGQGHLLVELRHRLVVQVGDFRLHWKRAQEPGVRQPFLHATVTLASPGATPPGWRVAVAPQ